MEPDNLAEIRDVVFLARDILSERTFSFIARTVEDSSTFSLATIRTSSGGTSYDFDVLPEGSSDNGVVLTLTPSTTRVPFNFVLRPDTLPEGPEAFTVSATSAPGFPTLPATSTLIIITDNDSKLPRRLVLGTSFKYRTRDKLRFWETCQTLSSCYSHSHPGWIHTRLIYCK